MRTVHGFGYAFAATVARDQPTPPPGSLRGGAWWLHSESTHAKLHEGENAVGRELPTDVWLDSGSVSRRHAKIVVEGMTAWLEDLGSKNGTTVNGQKVDDAGEAVGRRRGALRGGADAAAMGCRGGIDGDARGDVSKGRGQGAGFRVQGPEATLFSVTTTSLTPDPCPWPRQFLFELGGTIPLMRK